MNPTPKTLNGSATDCTNGFIRFPYIIISRVMFALSSRESVFVYYLFLSVFSTLICLRL